MTPSWAGFPRRIGLLGGSFNPAHEGHRHISLWALRVLGLDEVWWMVSPQNPLKSTRDMAPLEERMARAMHVANDPRILVTDIERQLGTRYTIDTLRAIKRRFPDKRFVWLIGADNMVQMPRWRNWRAIFHIVPIAVFPRPTYTGMALSGKAARRFEQARVRRRRDSHLADRTPPAWFVLQIPTHPASATAIRGARAREIRHQHTWPTSQGEKAIDSSAPSFPPSVETLALVEKSLDDDKAQDVVVIQLAGKSNIADYMVVASGTSQRHVGAMAERLREKLKTIGVSGVSVEGLTQSDWVLLDAGDVVVHLFRPEVRDFYNLEKMWAIPPAAVAGKVGAVG